MSKVSLSLKNQLLAPVANRQRLLLRREVAGVAAELVAADMLNRPGARQGLDEDGVGNAVGAAHQDPLPFGDVDPDHSIFATLGSGPHPTASRRRINLTGRLDPAAIADPPSHPLARRFHDFQATPAAAASRQHLTSDITKVTFSRLTKPDLRSPGKPKVVEDCFTRFTGVE
jgi:hypothetical protein